MDVEKPHIDEITNEIQFSTSRSGGPGGQHVNKVNTKVTLRWDVQNSSIISNDQRLIIMNRLDKVINNDGEVVLYADSNRSQIQNKAEVVDKLDSLLKKAFFVPKKRKSTKPTKSSVKKRLDTKRMIGEKKKQRRSPGDESW